MDSIFSYSQLSRDKGRPFTSKNLAITYQYVLKNTLAEKGIKIIDIKDIDKHKYTISFIYNNKQYSDSINSDKVNSARKVQEYISKRI